MASPLMQGDRMAQAPDGAVCEVMMISPARQLPDGRADRVTGIREIVSTYGQIAAQAADLARISALRTYHQARNRTIQACSRATEEAQALARQTWTRAGEFKEEHPVQLLGILAGTAFLAGIAMRLWRSRSL